MRAPTTKNLMIAFGVLASVGAYSISMTDAHAGSTPYRECEKKPKLGPDTAFWTRIQFFFRYNGCPDSYDKDPNRDRASKTTSRSVSANTPGGDIDNDDGSDGDGGKTKGPRGNNGFGNDGDDGTPNGFPDLTR